MDNLPELRDIHIPDGVPFFPLAWGWWILAATILLLPLLWQFFKAGLKQSKKLYAIHILNNINRSEIIPAATKTSELLRRICIYKYPEAVNLFAKDWINFLNQHGKTKISANAAELLSNAPYIRKNSHRYDENDLSNLIDFCRAWIGENL